MALILVTGASTGLGLAAATALAGDGHDVVLHARNPERVDESGVREAMKAVVIGDVADRDETLAVAEQANAIGRFDAVIHNAGVMRGPVIGVNLVAPYLLTAAMTRAKRLIYLSSSMHQSGSTDLGRLDLTDTREPGNSYSDSKLYLTALAMAVADRRPDAMVHAVDPGWVPTRMGGTSATDDLDEGHHTQVWLASADEAEIEPRSGGYWHHMATAQPHRAAKDAKFWAALLHKLEAHTGLTL